jgi:predicted small integral membrane protein
MNPGGSAPSGSAERPAGHLPVIRLSKVALVLSVGAWVALVAFGNITDYGTNLVAVQHTLRMDTIPPDVHIHYRALSAPALHQAAYLAIIAAEALCAALCWAGGLAMARRRRADAALFQRAKSLAVAGLTLGVVIWQLGFLAIAGEWFGAWLSPQWNPADSAFRFAMLILGVLIYVIQPDG